MAGLLAAALAGCGGGDNAANPAGGAGAAPSASTGDDVPVVVDGSSTVYRISKAAQEAYSEVDPEAEVTVSFHGTGAGFGAYLRGEVDVIDASRPARPTEEEQAKAKGFDWTRCIVGHDGITLAVNKKNDFARRLTVDQLRAVWEPGSKVKTWKDLNPGWPDRAIKLFSPDKDSGTFEFFTEAIVGTARKQRDDVQASADDNVLATGVSGDPDALGYFGYAYYAANQDKLNVVAVVPKDGGEAVLPSQETILDGRYKPLSRPLFLYVKDASLARPACAGFIKYYLEHVAEVARDGGYVPPTAEEIAANAQAIGARGGAKAAATP